MSEDFAAAHPRPSLVAAPAVAGPFGITKRMKQARGLFEQGERLYDEQKHEDAAKAFAGAAELWEAETELPSIAGLIGEAAEAARANATIARREWRRGSG